MVEIKFLNPITNRPSRFFAKKFICKSCGNQIKGEVVKPAMSFDFYHPECREKKIIVIIDDVVDESSKISDEDWESFQVGLK